MYLSNFSKMYSLKIKMYVSKLLYVFVSIFWNVHICSNVKMYLSQFQYDHHHHSLFSGTHREGRAAVCDNKGKKFGKWKRWDLDLGWHPANQLQRLLEEEGKNLGWEDNQNDGQLIFVSQTSRLYLAVQNFIMGPVSHNCTREKYSLKASLLSFPAVALLSFTFETSSELRAFVSHFSRERTVQFSTSTNTAQVNSNAKQDNYSLKAFPHFSIPHICVEKNCVERKMRNMIFSFWEKF